jgi:hypothetical protein
MESLDDVLMHTQDFPSTFVADTQDGQPLYEDGSELRPLVCEVLEYRGLLRSLGLDENGRPRLLQHEDDPSFIAKNILEKYARLKRKYRMARERWSFNVHVPLKEFATSERLLDLPPGPLAEHRGLRDCLEDALTTFDQGETSIDEDKAAWVQQALQQVFEACAADTVTDFGILEAARLLFPQLNLPTSFQRNAR